jgi:glucokinase
MILAGDIGGTKTLLGMFDPDPSRPRPVTVRSFGTLDHDLAAMIVEFTSDAALRASRSMRPASASPAP